MRERLVLWCHEMCEAPWFSHLFTTAIVLNTLMQCIAYSRMPAALCQTLDALSFVFTILFTAEVLIKMIGLGMHVYLSELFNIIDGVVVLVSAPTPNPAHLLSRSLAPVASPARARQSLPIHSVGELGLFHRTRQPRPWFLGP